jgi:hypothetical protein
MDINFYCQRVLRINTNSFLGNCRVYVFLIFIFFCTLICNATEKNPHLLQVIDGIKANLETNKKLQAKFIINCTISADNSIIKYDREVTIDNDSVRVDQIEEKDSTYTQVCHKDESWRYSPSNKNITIVPIKKMMPEFVFDPREVGNVTTKYSLVEIIAKYSCTNTVVENKENGRLVKCNFELPSLQIKENIALSLNRKITFASEYSYMPILVEQYMNDLLAFGLKINYSKPIENHGWIFCDLTYSFYNALDRLVPEDGLPNITKELCTQKINMKLSVLSLNKPINPLVFSIPNDLPIGTVIYNEIKEEVIEVGKNNVIQIEAFHANSFIYWRMVVIILGFLCLVIAYIFRNRFQKI